MKEHRLLQQLGHIDDDLIEEAGRHFRPVTLYRFGAAAVAAAVLAAAILLPWDKAEIPAKPDESTSVQQPQPSDGATNGTAADTTTAQTTTAKNTTTEAAYSTTQSASTTTANALYTTVKSTDTATKKTAMTESGQSTAASTTVKPTATKYVKDPELALIPQWEEKTVQQKFPEVPYGAATYSVYYPIDPANVGDELTTVTATGQDVYTDTYHTIRVTLYRLADIAPQCAVAVRYEGDNAYYSAVATWYQPLTLGEFLEGLQLEKYGVFGSVQWDYLADGIRHYRTYSGIGKEAVFDLLLDDPALPNVYDDEQWFVNDITISVDLPILGLKNPVVITLSEDGYLFTNILGCGKTFYIGTERLKAFMAYVQENGTVSEYTHPTESTVTQKDGTAQDTTVIVGTTHTTPAYIPE